MMLTLPAQADVASARRMLGTAVRQLPFVTATALTAVVRQAQKVEVAALISLCGRGHFG